MRLIIAVTLVSLGLFLWIWGGVQLAREGKHYLWKIHALGISDTIGTLFILTGSLVYSFENWPHLLLAMGAVSFWGTAFSFVMARLGRDVEKGGESE